MFFKSSLFFCVLTTALSVTINTTELKCPTGWFEYRDSCYFIDNPLAEYDRAQARCWEQGATLLVAETPEEYTYVTEHSKPSTWSWVGITQEDENHLPKWSNNGGVDPATMINWLVKPFTPVANGWSTTAKCAAHLNVPVSSAAYTFFLPCNIQINSICEKNSTLFPRIWDHGLVNLK
ncbi:lectin C-type domain protein [Ancylostoma caninum]|uniref:Lectin C-type domain protein n=1 Tax=Ancylostoma caninum TaxID=29170 RepID=A0A368FFL4_ANCCA|nr:lectin C-type domain protein [Ancylostoma caninum]